MGTTMQSSLVDRATTEVLTSMDEKHINALAAASTQKTPVDRVRRDFEKFEKSIRDIDTKFGLLNVNLQKYQDITDSTRQELLEQWTDRKEAEEPKLGSPYVAEVPDQQS